MPFDANNDLPIDRLGKTPEWFAKDPNIRKKDLP